MTGEPARERNVGDQKGHASDPAIQPRAASQATVSRVMPDHGEVKREEEQPTGSDQLQAQPGQGSRAEEEEQVANTEQEKPSDAAGRRTFPVRGVVAGSGL